MVYVFTAASNLFPDFLHVKKGLKGNKILKRKF